MEKIARKSSKNKSSTVALFEGSGTDELYLKVKSECDDWHHSAKIYWQRLYNQHHMLLDKNFISQLQIDSFSRLWELTQIHYLSEHTKKGLELIKQVGTASKPDFCFKLQSKSFYHEAVCSSPGERAELNVSLAEISGKARRTPIVEYMESLCSAIREKAHTKYYGKNMRGYKSHMEENSGLIIAVSMAKIPFYNQPNNLDVDLRCIFGMSPMKLPLIPGSNSKLIMGDPYHDYQSSFNKTTNQKPNEPAASIKMDYFADDQYSHISAIILSHSGLVFFPGIDKFVDYCNWQNYQNDYTLIHNPFALIPLPIGFFNVAREVTATVTNQGIDINFLNLFDRPNL